MIIFIHYNEKLGFFLSVVHQLSLCTLVLLTASVLTGCLFPEEAVSGLVYATM